MVPFRQNMGLQMDFLLASCLLITTCAVVVHEDITMAMVFTSGPWDCTEKALVISVLYQHSLYVCVSVHCLTAYVVVM